MAGVWPKVATALFGSVLLLGGCKRQPASSAAPPALAEVRLGFFPNLTHAQAVLGVASGDFAAAVAPAKFTPRPFNAGPSLIEALFNKQIDIGYVGPGPVVNAWVRSHGDAIRVVSGAAGSGVIIVARKGSGITSMAGLAGKRIATPQHGNTQDIAARHYVSSVLHEPDTHNVLAIPNSDQAALMSRGDIDAAWDPEPWGSLLMKTTAATLVGQERDLWPAKDFSLTVVVTSPEFLAAHGDVVAAVLKVNHAWTQKLSAAGGQYADQLDAELATLTGKKMPGGLTAEAIKRVHFTDTVLPDTFKLNAQWATDLGFARTTPDLTGLVDLSVLDRVTADAALPSK